MCISVRVEGLLLIDVEVVQWSSRLILVRYSYIFTSKILRCATEFLKPPLADSAHVTDGIRAMPYGKTFRNLPERQIIPLGVFVFTTTHTILY